MSHRMTTARPHKNVTQTGIFHLTSHRFPRQSSACHTKISTSHDSHTKTIGHTHTHTVFHSARCHACVNESTAMSKMQFESVQRSSPTKSVNLGASATKKSLQTNLAICSLQSNTPNIKTLWLLHKNKWVEHTEKRLAVHLQCWTQSSLSHLQSVRNKRIMFLELHSTESQAHDLRVES